jgi:hypothetical protein
MLLFEGNPFYVQHSPLSLLFHAPEQVTEMLPFLPMGDRGCPK